MRRGAVISFNDGVSIDTGGPLRAIHLKDGWYVVGEGWLIPVADREEALEEIATLKGSSKS